jgi:hypothetical protein
MSYANHSRAGTEHGSAFLAPQPSAEPTRARMRLIDWTPIGKGFLVGRAKVLLPSGLEIGDIGLFAKDGRTWAQLPASPMHDAKGRLITDARGRPRYVSSLRWSTRELQDGFSEALIALVDGEHPGSIPGGGA